MSEPSDEADRAWDEDPKDEPAATSGEAEVHRVDTVPPPASGDAYSADTVIRDVPREALDAIREKRKNSENRRAAAATDASSKEPKAEEKKVEPEPKPSEKAAEKRAPAPSHAHAKTIAPPPTSGELVIAFAAAVALIVVGFYVIASAF